MLVATLLASGLGGVVAYAMLQTTVPPPLGDPGSWRLVFDDGFQGSALNTSSWSPGWFGSGITGPLTPTSLECFDPAPGQAAHRPARPRLPLEAGGLRRVTATLHRGDRHDATASSPLPMGSSRCARVYRGRTASSTTGPISGPMGGTGRQTARWTSSRAWAAVHASISTRSRGRRALRLRAPPSGWHTFGADWEPGRVTYYYDGRAVGTSRRNHRRADVPDHQPRRRPERRAGPSCDVPYRLCPRLAALGRRAPCCVTKRAARRPRSRSASRSAA